MNEANEKRLSQLGAFEISDKMLALAQKNKKSNVFLNAGKGNPNWINKKARLAFNRLVEFGIEESERSIADGDLVGYVEENGIHKRFNNFLMPENQIDQFLLQVLEYAGNHHFTLDSFIKELVDGVLGNNYPVPNRVLKYTERILNLYLESVLYDGVALADETQIFPTEGGTAAIVYIFQSLKENKLIQPGDKIAINKPIFTPYLQIPELNDYELIEIDLTSTEENDWELQPEEIEKLKDPSIKAFFMVNPSNPGSMALSKETLQELKNMVAEKPNLMIVTDDVYGTFVEGFQTIYAVAPHNTLLVYSFSKLFGATGWRLGLIAAHQDNIFDRLIQQLSPENQLSLTKRYNQIVIDPRKLAFIDRMVADSRSIGLYHTAGLSTPQQIMEMLFALTHLLTKKQDAYILAARELVNQRYEQLHEALQLPSDESKENAKYYSLIDIYQLAETRYGKPFRDYLTTHFDHIDFLLNLAEKHGVVLMDGVGFGTTDGDLRVSQANLPTKDYPLIGHEILELLQEYYQKFQTKE